MGRGGDRNCRERGWGRDGNCRGGGGGGGQEL